MNKFSPVALALGLVFAHSAIAEDGFRQHDAHVHGEVEFNIAQDGNELLVEITAPGADVVGFEHAPENDAQKQALEKAVAKLNQATDVLSISAAANCQVEHVAVSHTLGEDEHAHHDHDHDHDHH
ncbi:ZrgA family zinc uptake protein, partial [Vibrio ponticus]|uniref:ZrgA family zinc uptake protein n=1 Tax=Vibrio ponticus TaxID=265668 RepID=UPI001115460F